MGRHTFIDNVVASIGGLYGDSMKFFSDGIQSPPLQQLIRRAEVEAPAPEGVGEQTARVRIVPPRERPDTNGMDTMDAAMAEVAPDDGLEVDYSVLAWAGPTAPSLIFHHGSGDHPYQARLRTIMGLSKPGSGQQTETGINLIATNSPFNRSKRDYYRAVRDLGRFSLLLAGSVALVQRLVVLLRHEATVARGADAQTPKIVVAGISLGGWVTNLHHSSFDSADEYRPIFAGAALDAIFTESTYRKLTARSAREHPDRLRRVLNFEPAFKKRPNTNVHALLARHDRYIQLQRQGAIYRPDQLEILEKGHITGAADHDALRSFLLDAFRPAEPAAA